MTGPSVALRRHDVAVDFMDMTDARRLWACPVDTREELDLAVGRHVTVGDEGADPRVAQIVAVDEDGNIDLEVLDGSVESHADLLDRA